MNPGMGRMASGLRLSGRCRKGTHDAEDDPSTWQGVEVLSADELHLLRKLIFVGRRRPRSPSPPKAADSAGDLRRGHLEHVKVGASFRQFVSGAGPATAVKKLKLDHMPEAERVC
eukprot:12412461-Karenia_brevis.AAC.1